MKHKNIRQTYQHIRHQYLTTSNVVLALAIMIGATWAWSSIGVMQRNYELQRQLVQKERQKELITLQAKLLEYQRNYHQSTEYQELAARDKLGLADPGEKALILPEYVLATKTKPADDPEASTAATATATQPSNFDQWKSFLFGQNRRNLQESE